MQSLIDQIQHAVENKDLLSLRGACADKFKLKTWLEQVNGELEKNLVNQLNEGVNVTHRDLDSVNEHIQQYQEDLIPIELAWRELSRELTVVNEVELFFSCGDLIITFECMAVEIDGAFFLFRDVTLSEIKPPIQRHLDTTDDRFIEFKQATQWPDNARNLIADGKADELVAAYQKAYAQFDEDDDIEPANLVTFCEPGDVQVLADVEAAIGRPFPTELAEWWLSKESICDFGMGDWYIGYIYTPKKMHQMMANQEYTHSVKRMGMAEVLDYLHSGEFKELLSADDYDALNRDYTICGAFSLGDSDALYIYFDKNGRFGLIEYNHEWRHHNGLAWNAEYKTLLTASRATNSLAEIVAQLMELSIYCLADDY